MQEQTVLTPLLIKQSYKAKAKAAAVPFFKSLAAGLLGTLVGKGLGRPSLLVGTAVTFAGHMHGAHKEAEKQLGSQSGAGNVYNGDSPLVAFGIGMIAGGAMSRASADQTVEGKTSYLDGVKDRLSEFKDDLYHRLYLDKFSSDGEPQKESGVGAITFTGKQYESGDITFSESELDKIERELQQRAIDYQSKGSSESENISGLSGDFGELICSRLL